MNADIDLASLLLAMGPNADALAATLRTAGIQGVRNTARFLNPLARSFQRHILLDNYSLDLMQPGTLRLRTHGASREFLLPPPVADFLTAFNAGAYPDLELPA